MGFVIKSSVKKFLKQNEMRVAMNTYEKLDKKMETQLKEACERAKTNGRTTVMPQDV